MFRHRFLQEHIPAETPEEEFARSLKRGAITRYLERIWGLMQCRVRIHRGGLMADKKGFYKLCTKCAYYERIDYWKLEKRKR